MRTVNDQMRDLDAGAAGWADVEQRFDFQCECGKIDGCGEVVQMTLRQYERVRSQRDRFAVVPGHEEEEIEDIVEKNERFVIVDKRDPVEHLVE